VNALGPEDLKLVRLARASWSRVGAPEGAAVRDLDGRTYAAVNVALPSLRLSALELAVAMAASSGATGLEAAAVVSAARPPAGARPDADEPGARRGADGSDSVRDLGGKGVPIFLAGAEGELHDVRVT
jgi:hypothetical protein